MDLTTVSGLTKSEQFEIASAMHAMVLEELFLATNWQAPQAVFHGGTALSFARNSARFSEDLDFMLDEKSAADLETALRRTRKRVELNMSGLYPGSSVELKGPKGAEVSLWTFEWSHPSRRGKVKVKAEFLITTKDVLNAYRSAHLVLCPKGPISVTTAVPVPELVSAWADKIKAIATRPAFKWRDAFDLAFIADCMAREPELDEAVRLDALAATAAVYGKTIGDVTAGLEGVLASGVFESYVDFEDDMRRWFADDTWQMYRERNMFRNALSKAGREVSKALDLAAAPTAEIRP